MTQASSRPPPNLQPRPKAFPTFSNTSLAAISTATPPHISRSSSRSRHSSPARPVRLSDASEKATAALVRRVLCPHSHASGTTEPRPLDELLPPLTSSNDVDLQLYAIIAIVVKDLVHSWYGKITPDQGFVEEVVKIVAHCTRALEGRLRHVDLESLFFDEIPNLVEGHITTYRVSHQGRNPPPLSTDPRIVYHNLNPHPALSPVPNPAVASTVSEQRDHEAEYRQLLVQGALAVLLPTEDLENTCLRTLVADVIAESILGNAIGGKVCEGYFIWGSISKLVDVVKARVESKTTGEEIEVDTRSRLEKFGLLAEKGKDRGPNEQNGRSTFLSIFWRILQYGYLTFITIRFVIVGLIAASSEPMRSSTTSKISNTAEMLPMEKTIEPPCQPYPILGFRIFPLISSLLDLSSRMPWLSGSLALLQHHLIHGPFQAGATDGILDQYIHHLIMAHLHPPTLLPPALLLARQTLFPNSTLPPPAPPSPSPSEAAAAKRSCALSLLSVLPSPVCRLVFGTEDTEGWVSEIAGELDVWGDGYLNKHLGYALLELVVVRVLPELAEKGPEELLRARLGNEST